MIAALGLMLLGLVIGASATWTVQARERRRVARMVALFAPYRAVGTAAPADIVAVSTAGWRHV